jgi:hypothetical protein
LEAQVPAYKSEKRMKELARLKKREEKRLRRLQKKQGPDGEPLPEGAEPSADEEAAEAQDSSTPVEPDPA